MKDAGKQTQDQIAAANRLASAAEVANNNALDSNRPWIGSTALVVEGAIKPGTPLIAHLQVMNAGNRPATVTRFRAQEQVFERFPSQPVYNKTTTPFRENSESIALPRVPLQVDFPFLVTAAEYQDVISKKKRLYMHAIVEYMDVEPRLKDTKHSTRICYFWTLSTNNSFGTCSQYNDVD